MATRLHPLPLRNIRITDPFWAKRIHTTRTVSIPYMLDALHDRIPDVPKSHCIRNLRIAAGVEQGKFEGFVFQDSDLYKWLEGVAYALETHPDPALEAEADAIIALAGKAQQPDGYLDTYYIINGLDKRWSNLRDHHELYVAGHMMEAAVAYRQATGKDALLQIACRFADHIGDIFGPGEHQKHGYPGHQEIELGLVKLYEATGTKRYLDLAAYFLLERGKQPYYYDLESKARGEEPPRSPFAYDQPYSYHQAHLPVTEQTEVTGHAVRACYMLAGMADVAALTGDARLQAAVSTLFDDVVNRQMYLTGGVGSTNHGEAFTFDYDIPNDRMYTETCAAISLLMTSQRLLDSAPEGRYADVCERTLYNGILSGISLDGTKYFYMNPLEMWPERAHRRHDSRLDTQRQGWFGCACCPPNVLRTMTGLGRYLYGVRGDEIYVHQYIASEADFALPGGNLTLSLQGSYPWEETLRLTVHSEKPIKAALMLRKPGWCTAPRLTINGTPVDVAAHLSNGYIGLERTYQEGDTLELTLPMPATRMYCNDNVPYNAGKVALMRGPLVYCLEQQDNGEHLWNLRLGDGGIAANYQPELLEGVVTLRAGGFCERLPDDALYSAEAGQEAPCTLQFVPYFAWCNRTPGEMTVWVRR